MTATDKRTAEIVAKIDQCKAQIVTIKRNIIHAELYRMGRGACDDRVGLYFAECALEELQLDLGDELYDDAWTMDANDGRTCCKTLSDEPHRGDCIDGDHDMKEIR